MSTKSWLDRIREKYEEWKSVSDKHYFLSRYAEELIGVLERVNEGERSYKATDGDCKGHVIGGCLICWIE